MEIFTSGPDMNTVEIPAQAELSKGPAKTGLTDIVPMLADFVFLVSKKNIEFLSKEKIGKISVIAYFLSVFTFILGAHFSCALLGHKPGLSLMMINFITALVVFSASILAFLSWLSLVSSLSGAAVNARLTLDFIFLSFLPLILSLPASVLFIAFAVKNAGLYFVILSIFLCSIAVMNVFTSVREIYSFGTGRTLLVFMLPIFIFQILTAFAVIAGIMYLYIAFS